MLYSYVLAWLMEETRRDTVERLAGDGELTELKRVLGTDFTQIEIDVALENAIAYSQIETADYLLSLGADFSNYNYQGVYYSVHNGELNGLKFSISRGVDINVNNGMPLNTSIHSFIYSGNIDIVKWLLDNGANPKLLTNQSLELINRYGSPELKRMIKNATQ